MEYKERLEKLVLYLIGPAFVLRDKVKAKEVIKQALEELEMSEREAIAAYYLADKNYTLPRPTSWRLWRARQKLFNVIDAEKLAACCYFVGDSPKSKTTLETGEVAELLFSSRTRVHNLIYLIRRGFRDLPLPVRTASRRLEFPAEVFNAWREYLVEASRCKRKELVEELSRSR